MIANEGVYGKDGLLYGEAQLAQDFHHHSGAGAGGGAPIRAPQRQIAIGDFQSNSNAWAAGRQGIRENADHLKPFSAAFGKQASSCGAHEKRIESIFPIYHFRVGDHRLHDLTAGPGSPFRQPTRIAKASNPQGRVIQRQGESGSGATIYRYLNALPGIIAHLRQALQNLLLQRMARIEVIVRRPAVQAGMANIPVCLPEQLL